MAKPERKQVSAANRDTFTKDQLALIKKLQDDVLRAREKLRNKTGALREAQNELYNGLAEGLQMKLWFGEKPEEDDKDDGEPETLGATG